MQSLTAPDEFDAVLQAPLAVVYKHSTRCPISLLAADAMAEFEDAYADVPVYVVDVTADRNVSRHVAAELGVTHHSPQVIIMAHGRVAWHGSHFEVRAEAVGRRVAALRESEGAEDDEGAGAGLTRRA